MTKYPQSKSFLDDPHQHVDLKTFFFGGKLSTTTTTIIAATKNHSVKTKF